MATYAFKALDLAGAPSKGEIEASDKQAVASQLRSRGLIVRIAETVDRTLWSLHPFSWPEVACHFVNRIAQRSFENIDALFVVRMAVWRRDIRSCGHSQLE